MYGKSRYTKNSAGNIGKGMAHEDLAGYNFQPLIQIELVDEALKAGLSDVLFYSLNHYSHPVSVKCVSKSKYAPRTLHLVQGMK